MTNFIFRLKIHISRLKMYIFKLKIYISSHKINLIPYLRHPCQGIESASLADLNSLASRICPGRPTQATSPAKTCPPEDIGTKYELFYHCLPHNSPIFASKIKKRDSP